VKVVVLREKQHQTLTLKVGELPAEHTASAAGTKHLDKLGLTVHDLTNDLAQQRGYKPGEGVMVTQLAPHSAAARAGLHPAMLIRQVNQQPIETLKPSSGSSPLEMR
jgi:serine protease Do